MRADALRHLASEPVDVLFTDINLPGGMDGAALARRARELFARSAGRLCLRRGRMCSIRTLRVPGSIFVPKPYGRPGRTTSGPRVRAAELRGRGVKRLLLDRAAREEFLEPVDVIVAIDDIGFAHQRAKQGQRRFDAVDDELVERAL